jgi:hypothetical protein
MIYFAENFRFVEMSMNQIKLYDLFRRELHLSDDKAAEAVYAVQEMTESAFTSKKDVLATKEDLYSIKSELKKDILATKEDLYSLRSELKKDIQDTKDNLYRAIYLSGILQFIAMTGSLLAIIKLMK